MTCSIADIINASQCVHNWLGYLNNASDNSELIAESSLKYPFVECLERHSINNVHLEFPHPLFEGKRIDAYIGNLQSDQKKDKTESQKIYVEFKFVRGDTLTTNEQQRYFNDLMRLSYLKQQDNSSVKCLFLVCGKSDSFNAAFKCSIDLPYKNKFPVDEKGKRRKQKKSIYNDWFSFNMKNAHKQINTNNQKYSKLIDSFNENYQPKVKKNVLPKWREYPKLHTQLLLMLFSNNNIDNSYSLGLWEIL